MKTTIFSNRQSIEEAEENRPPKRVVVTAHSSPVKLKRLKSPSMLQEGGLDLNRNWTAAGPNQQGVHCDLGYLIPNRWIMNGLRYGWIRKVIGLHCRLVGITLTWLSAGSKKKDSRCGDQPGWIAGSGGTASCSLRELQFGQSFAV